MRVLTTVLKPTNGMVTLDRNFNIVKETMKKSKEKIGLFTTGN